MALRNINLVPDAVLQRRLLIRHAVGWGLVYGLVIAILVGGHLSYTHRTMPTCIRHTTEEQARRQVAQIISEIDHKNQEIERLAFVRHVSYAFGASEILGRLADIMDSKTWLSKVSLRATPDGAYALEMKGLAYSNARLGATIRALTVDAHFEDVVFRDAVDVKQMTTADGAPENLVQFKMEARVLAK